MRPGLQTGGVGASLHGDGFGLGRWEVVGMGGGDSGSGHVLAATALCTEKWLQ